LITGKTAPSVGPTQPLTECVSMKLPRTFERQKVGGAKTRGVIAGLVPAPTLLSPRAGESRVGEGTVPDYRDGRDKPGHDQPGTATRFAPLTSEYGKRVEGLRWQFGG